ncbi:relaxase/mobilization nuclease domain-containing protein [Caulobacter sp. KR2-114]|jgi:type IV secretory pathway VirD2 relaxase|uniref:relaxase/mobilization nuclease domain-containing protein n=1 Tax=Caulobacter sp. KR2-114 TaxID=3400912 RepID=UPI003BFD3565
MRRDEDFRIRPGRIRHGGGRASARARSFVGQVLRAANRAGGQAHGRKPSAGSRFGRGRGAAIASVLRNPNRRVALKARVVRHRGNHYRAAPLDLHLRYLKREGVDREGRDARMFDAGSDAADDRAFASRCEDDRHHFRFMVSPEDAGELESLRETTRDLMAQAERDLGTRLDWIAVDHWNTDNPHVHVLVRGVTDDGTDLVISRDYISHGLRARAEALVSLELGPRSEREVNAGLERQVTSERWTGLDQALLRLADQNDGQIDLRPGAPDPDSDTRRLLIGRAQVLERLGLAEPEGPAVWRLRPDHERTLRALGERGDIIKILHRAMGEQRGAAELAPHGEQSADPILGRLAGRGLHDEVGGEAFVVIDSADGRAHHVRVPSLEATGDTPVGGLVEFRPSGEPKAQGLLLHRSDLGLARQVKADGATWLDRQLVAREPAPLAHTGFGAEVRAALQARAEHLGGEGLARPTGSGWVFAKDLIQTLRTRELATVAARLSAESGLAWKPTAEGDPITGQYRQRLNLASGRFAMIDDGLGFQLVPWSRQLERHLGDTVSGTLTPGGGVEWTLGRKRGLSL